MTSVVQVSESPDLPRRSHALNLAIREDVLVSLALEHGQKQSGIVFLPHKLLTPERPLQIATF